MRCDFNNTTGITISQNAKLVINNISTPRNNRYRKTSTNYEAPLSLTMQICKNNCNGGSEEISLLETSQLIRWLTSKRYEKIIVKDKDLNNRLYFYGIFTAVREVLSNGKTIGFELQIETNLPYLLNNEVITLNSTTTKNIHNISCLSDEYGDIYPTMFKITMLQNGDFSIKNNLDENRTMYISDCSNGEIITINCDDKTIETTFDNHNIANDFNYKFFRFINEYLNSTNILTVSIPCDIYIEYPVARKVDIQ